MQPLYENIKRLRLQKGWSQQRLADMVGYSDRSSIAKIESGLVDLSRSKIEEFADALGVSPVKLMGIEETDKKALPANIIPMPSMNRIPIIGDIACGTPILADENCEGEVDIPSTIHADFALRCKGDSMINARIFDGDIVYIRCQESVEHGEIAAVLVDDAATLKRVYLYDDHISLEAENPQYRPIVYWGEDMNDVRILGKAVAFTSVVR